MYVSKPKFYKNDQRRNYINMFVNVYHANDENFTKNFYQTMWHPEAKYKSIERGKVMCYLWLRFNTHIVFVPLPSYLYSLVLYMYGYGLDTHTKML